MSSLIHSGDYLGVPLAKPRVALSSASPRTDYRAVGFPLQSLTRNATGIVLVLLIAAFVTGCSSNEDAIMGRSWIIDKGEYLGNPIEFRSTDFLQLTDVAGNIFANLEFSNDGSIGLPGINGPNMRGLWRIEDDSIFLSLDSARYARIRTNLTQWHKNQLAKGDSTVVLNDTTPQPGELESGDFSAAMDIYKHPFAFVIDGEHMVLRSKTTRITAHQDRTIDKMFEGL